MSNFLQTSQAFFNSLGPNSMQTVQEFYHPEITFIDPLGTIRGVHQLEKYYRHLYRNVTNIRFEFSNCAEVDSTLYLPWAMHLQARKLNDGKEVVVDGISHIRMDVVSEKAIYHRDYFDLDAFIYRHVPIVRNVLGVIKKKLHPHG
jgi:limonene-1,2-epoxide hydrolase